MHQLLEKTVDKQMAKHEREMKWISKVQKQWMWFTN
jgi:hypothetical protein